MNKMSYKINYNPQRYTKLVYHIQHPGEVFRVIGVDRIHETRQQELEAILKRHGLRPDSPDFEVSGAFQDSRFYKDLETFRHMAIVQLVFDFFGDIR